MTEVARDLAQASVLLDLKRYDEAASLLARAVAAQPQDSRTWCLLAAAHLGAGRYEEAAAAASRAITLAPLDDGPYRLASIAQRHLGQITAAISSANQACKLAPDDWRAYACLAQAELATEADFLAQAESREAYFTAAERAAATAVRLAPDEPDAHFTAGLVSYAQRKWKAARAPGTGARAGPGPRRRAERTRPDQSASRRQSAGRPALYPGRPVGTGRKHLRAER